MIAIFYWSSGLVTGKSHLKINRVFRVRTTASTYTIYVLSPPIKLNTRELRFAIFFFCCADNKSEPKIIDRTNKTRTSQIV